VARFTPHTEADVEEMLGAIGVDSLDDLFADVSPKFEGELDLPSTLSEHEALADVNEAAKENVAGLPIFVGAGAYDRTFRHQLHHPARRVPDLLHPVPA
jgi:glycine dehydrogenase subunit 1